jgi:hypothetical protein
MFFGCDNKPQNIDYNLQNRIDSLTAELETVKTELQLVHEDYDETLDEYSEIEDFGGFFWQFMTDSSFQKSRIKFPLDRITWRTMLNGDMDVFGDIDTLHILESNWVYDPFYIHFASERTQIYDNYKLMLRPTNERVLHWYGVENGGDAKYFFMSFESKWYLISQEQLGD